MKSEVQRLADQLKRAFDGEAWHGPCLREALDGVTAEQAAARPIAGAHSIWEVVAHVSAWEEVVGRRLNGEAVSEPDANFPEGSGETEWKALIARAHETHAKLVAQVATLTEEGMRSRIDEKPYPAWFMAHGAVGHALYHVGQIVLLKRALGL